MFIQSAAASTVSSNTYYVGQLIGGGMVFHLVDSKTALVVSTENIASPALWGQFGAPSGGFGSEVGDGYTNWQWILANMTLTDAVLEIYNYTGGGYTDWFMPSIGEWALINDRLFQTGLLSLTLSRYWSSSSDGCSNVTTDSEVYIPNGTPSPYSCVSTRRTLTSYIRAIRIVD